TTTPAPRAPIPPRSPRRRSRPRPLPARLDELRVPRLEGRGQLLDQLRLLRRPVVPLAEVGGQVEQFRAAGHLDQLPVALTHRRLLAEAPEQGLVRRLGL